MRAGYSEETEHRERVPEIFMGSPFDIKLPSNEQSQRCHHFALKLEASVMNFIIVSKSGASLSVCLI